MIRRRRVEKVATREAEPSVYTPHPDGAVYFPEPKEGPTFSWWPSYGPEKYLGQLADDFQADLAKQREFLRPEHCRFYHTVDVPDAGTIDGAWDLRGRERAYLGGIDVRGKRVLELGPSSGHLTYWMERQGADVVAFDAGWDVEHRPVARARLRDAQAPT